MAEKELNVRVKNRVTTESQWNSLTDIPKEGELLIYEPSSSTSASNQYRIKIGNGTSRPSQLSFAIDPTDFSDPTVTQTYSSAGTMFQLL